MLAYWLNVLRKICNFVYHFVQVWMTSVATGGFSCKSYQICKFELCKITICASMVLHICGASTCGGSTCGGSIYVDSTCRSSTGGGYTWIFLQILKCNFAQPRLRKFAFCGTMVAQNVILCHHGSAKCDFAQPWLPKIQRCLANLFRFARKSMWRLHMWGLYIFGGNKAKHIPKKVNSPEKAKHYL